MSFDQTFLIVLLSLAATIINAYISKTNWEMRRELQDKLQDCEEKLAIKTQILRR